MENSQGDAVLVSDVKYEEEIFIPQQKNNLKNSKGGYFMIDNEQGPNSNKSISSRPKYLKDILLIYFILTFFLMYNILFAIFIPGMFTNYVNFKYPNLSEKEIQSKSSHLKSIADAAPLCMVFFFGPLLGGLSDKYGRKKILLFQIILIAIDVSSAFISFKTNSIIFFYIGHTICGLTGCVGSTILSSISDLTTIEERPKVFSWGGVAMGVGFIGGPLLSALAMKLNVLAPIYFIYFTIAVMLVLLYLLKESIYLGEKGKAIVKTTFNPFKAIARLFKSSLFVALVAGLYVIFAFASDDLLSTMYYYTEVRYNWSPEKNAYYIAYLGVVIVVYSSLIIPFALKYLSERAVISTALFMNGIAHIIFAFASNQYIWIVSGLFGGFPTVILMIIVSIISKSTPPEIQGTILNGVASVGSLTALAGTLFSQNIFAYFISSNAPIYFPGAHFLIDSIPIFLTFLGSILIWKFYPAKQMDKGFQKVQIQEE
ncbi:hypothetical protein CYY_007948 [Polysphondylium violaceum]|uniref:Major facilitator superfamily (MFS) profile domain-containing protein n=1 Tax=Polysphondylium violaceum TaxID=133409 RepID=A0A8J4PP14_9MYCE|nr:hypothetical protein CYY_007948 [Polysphondylium violaceum]